MDYLFISDDALSGDVQLFFGKKVADETIYTFTKGSLDLPGIAQQLNLFPSKTQARKNGWVGDIPLGFGMKKCGHKRVVWFNSMDQILD